MLFRSGAFLNGAEAAAPGAEVPQKHEGGSPLVPTFADIRTGGALADGVQAKPLDQVLQLAVVVAHRGRGFEPIRAAGFGFDGNQHSFTDDSAAGAASVVSRDRVRPGAHRDTILGKS